jgi:DNA polymerase elongation subunit (family B)
MLRREEIEKLLYFDVETACIERDFGTLKNVNPRLAELWKKRATYYRGANPEISDWSDDEVYLSKASLEPEFSKVVCVSFGSYDDSSLPRLKSFYGENERDILNNTNKVLNNAHAKGWKLCGHNIKGFDIPCLSKRMIYNGINPSVTIQTYNKKPWEIAHMDTSEIFSFGSFTQQRYLSLDLLACSLGISSPKESMDGSKVNLAFWDDRKFEEIGTYCEADVETVMKVMEKICF